MQEYFKIGEISRLYGIGVDSLRYYEKIGILKPQRAESGYRHYSLQDIWKLNIIRDLRELGFRMEQIRDYLHCHSVDSTLSMLDREQTAIDQKIRKLQKLKDNVSERIETIRTAQTMEMDVITLQNCEPRKYYSISEGYSDEHEMDVLMRRLINMDKKHLYVIGNNEIGTVISLEKARKSGKVYYESVFVGDDQGEKTLPGGTYLSVSYRGDYEKSKDWVKKILAYAEKQGLTLKGNFLELLWIDIHTSADVQEHVTQLQILAEKAK